MKPEYEKAAEVMKEQQIPGVLAALDATKEGGIASQYGVKGYPSVLYFVNGEFKFDVRVRDSEKIVEFMKVHINKKYDFQFWAHFYALPGKFLR